MWMIYKLKIYNLTNASSPSKKMNCRVSSGFWNANHDNSISSRRKISFVLGLGVFQDITCDFWSFNSLLIVLAMLSILVVFWTSYFAIIYMRLSGQNIPHTHSCLLFHDVLSFLTEHMALQSRWPPGTPQASAGNHSGRQSPSWGETWKDWPELECRGKIPPGRLRV